MLKSYNFELTTNTISEIKNGNQHGREVGYYNSGKLWWEECWENGKQHGKEFGYWESGKTCWEGAWVEGEQTLFRNEYKIFIKTD